MFNVGGLVKEPVMIGWCEMSWIVELRCGCLSKNLIPTVKLVEVSWVCRVCCDKPVYQGFKREERCKAKIATLCEYIVSPLYDGSKKVKRLWVMESGRVKGEVKLAIDGGKCGVIVRAGAANEGDN